MSEPEEDLIARSRDGDVDAFNQIVDMYQRPLYNMALRMLGDAPAAEDATQDAFFSAFRNIGRFKGGNLKSWLFTIAANACRDVLRSRNVRRTESLDAEDVTIDPPSSTESPEDYAVRREMGQSIQQGLDSIPHDQRLAVVLIDVQGFGYEEAAGVMGISVGTVKSRLSRGRARVRDFLRDRHRACCPPGTGAGPDIVLEMLKKIFNRGHGRFLEMLSDYFDGELPEAERIALEAHLQGCDSCTEELESLRATVQLLQRMPEVEAPRSFRLAPAAVTAPTPPPERPVLLMGDAGLDGPGGRRFHGDGGGQCDRAVRRCGGDGEARAASEAEPISTATPAPVEL